MSKDALREAFSSTPLKEALEEKPIEEYTADQVRLSELGIPIEATKTLTLGWKQKYSAKKKVFHPNSDSLKNITKGFWIYVMDTIHPIDLLKIDTTLLTEDLTDITLKQIMNKDRSISDDYKKENEILKEQIFQLKKQSQKVIDAVEVVEHNKDTFDLLKWLYSHMSNMDYTDYKPTKEDIKNLQAIDEVVKQ